MADAIARLGERSINIVPDQDQRGVPLVATAIAAEMNCGPHTARDVVGKVLCALKGLQKSFP